MRNILLLIAVAAVAVTVYFMTSGQEAVVETGAPVTAPSATEDTEETVTEEIIEEAQEPVEAATEAVEEAVESAADAAEGVVEDAAEAAQEAVDEVVDQASEAVESATEAVTEAVGGEGALSDVLTVDGFDFDKAVEMIDGSDLGAVQKTTLKAGLEQARDNPELLSQLLDQIRDAMGL